MSHTATGPNKAVVYWEGEREESPQLTQTKSLISKFPPGEMQTWGLSLQKQASHRVHFAEMCCCTRVVQTPSELSYLSDSSLSRCIWHIGAMLRRPVSTSILLSKLVPLVAECRAPPCRERKWPEQKRNKTTTKNSEWRQKHGASVRTDQRTLAGR